MKSEAPFSREAMKNYYVKVLKKNSIIGGSWSTVELFVMHNYIDYATGNVPLTVEDV